jgi:hypothetical protein
VFVGHGCSTIGPKEGRFANLNSKRDFFVANILPGNNEAIGGNADRTSMLHPNNAERVTRNIDATQGKCVAFLVEDSTHGIRRRITGLAPLSLGNGVLLGELAVFDIENGRVRIHTPQEFHETLAWKSREEIL